LVKTQNWVVIEYSFNDLFIREIFLEYINRPSHKLIIIDPNASSIVRDHFGTNLEYINRPSHKLIIIDPNASSIVRDHFGTNRTNVEAIDNRVEDSETVLKVKKMRF
jgi:hypothetical protein